jgi:hypothetical protein
MSMNILFSSAVLLSAFLLFWVELFFAKLLLPQFGGGAHIWTTCLAAFQVLLLIGYGYAWGIAKLSLPRQAAAQVLLLLAAVATLPIGLKTWQITAIPSLQICFTITASVGLPMIALDDQFGAANLVWSCLEAQSLFSVRPEQCWLIAGVDRLPRLV